jgi:uncharacterized membrane protein YdjX (TVP38/TMEM64 family)
MNQETPASWLTARNRRRVLLLVVLVLTVIAGIQYNLLSRAQHAAEALKSWLETLGPWAPVIFVLIYVASCVVAIPASFLTLMAGVAFGVLTGSIVVAIGATLGATAAFLVGRYAVRDWVRRKVGDRPAFVAIDRAVAEDGWKIVFLTRLAPVFPFFLMNYGYSLTRVSLRQYIPATAIGILPGTILFVYAGSLAQPGTKGASLMDWVTRGFFLVTAIIALACLARIAKRTLARHVGAAQPELPPNQTESKK